MGAEVASEDPFPILACTISRDVQNFGILIDEMEAEFGEAWGDLLLSEAMDFLGQPDAAKLEILAVAVDDEDAAELDRILDVVRKARELSIGVLLIASDLDPLMLHKILQAGANEFLPYPIPEAGLSEAIERIAAPVVPPVASAVEAPVAEMPSKTTNSCSIFAVQGLAGGVGASTIAINLAYELATLKDAEPRVLIVDFNQQFGSVASYLDMSAKDAIYELLSDLESLDEESLRQAMQLFDDKLSVFTAPADILPLDFMPPEDVERMLEMASSVFDYIIIDMPSSLVNWTETVLRLCDVFYPVVELDMRSATNALRFLKTLKAEDLPVEKLRFVLNHAPKSSDLAGKGRVKRMEDSLDIELRELMPDGGKQVQEATDEGMPLAKKAAKNPLRKEVMRLATSLHEIANGEEEVKPKKKKKSIFSLGGS